MNNSIRLIIWIFEARIGRMLKLPRQQTGFTDIPNVYCVSESHHDICKPMLRAKYFLYWKFVQQRTTAPSILI